MIDNQIKHQDKNKKYIYDPNITHLAGIVIKHMNLQS
jgi:hypothetical protein